MPKYSVEVTRIVKQHRTVVVDAEDEDQIEEEAQKVIDCANDLDLWDWECSDKDEQSIMVHDTTDDEADLRL